MMQECWFCRGGIELRRIRHVYEWDQQIYIFENVPAEVCTQCGEQYCTPETIRRIETIVTGKPAGARQQQVPVYSL